MKNEKCNWGIIDRFHSCETGYVVLRSYKEYDDACIDYIEKFQGYGTAVCLISLQLIINPTIVLEHYNKSCKQSTLVSHLE